MPAAAGEASDACRPASMPLLKDARLAAWLPGCLLRRAHGKAPAAWQSRRPPQTTQRSHPSGSRPSPTPPAEGATAASLHGRSGALQGGRLLAASARRLQRQPRQAAPRRPAPAARSLAPTPPSHQVVVSGYQYAEEVPAARREQTVKAHSGSCQPGHAATKPPGHALLTCFLTLCPRCTRPGS